MNRYSKLVFLLGLIGQTVFTQIEWRYVAEINDEVAYAVVNNKVIYIHPDVPRTPLPAGLFFLRSKENEYIATPAKVRRRAVYAINNGIIEPQPYVYSNSIETQNPASGGYIHWDSGRNRARNIIYNRGQRFVDPSRSISKWRERENNRLASGAGAGPSRQQPQQPGVQAAQAIPVGMVGRNALFDNIMGISENEFKQRVGASGRKPDTAKARKEIDAQQGVFNRAHAIDDGDWSQPTLIQLRNSGYVKEVMNRARRGEKGQSSFNLLVHDRNNPKETDIRYLHEKFKDGFFLIASNANALEGAMGDYSKNLSGMNYHPVQGEEAAMATMPATIYRRYLLPPINLWQGLGDAFSIENDRFNTPRATGIKAGGSWQNVEGNFTIGIHQNIIVSSGYNDDGKMVPRINQPHKYKPAYNKEMPTDGRNVTRVTHLFASAHNLKGHQSDKMHIDSIAPHILRAGYEAGILAAIDRGAKDLVLTMLGAGAFFNPAQWISDALNRMKDVIRASDLNVYIIVRHKDKQIQNSFEQDMRQLRDYVNQPDAH